MTLEQYKEEWKEAWENVQAQPPEDYEREFVKLTGKFQKDFYNNNYTSAVDKEVEAIWLRKNSKLGRALR